VPGGRERLVKHKLKRLERRAQQDAVLIRQRDGTVKAFDRLTVQAELYLLMLDRGLGTEAHSSPFMDALENATPESRREVMAHAQGRFYDDLNEPGLAPGEPVEDLSEQAREPL
jgi:hypothetical protein